MGQSLLPSLIGFIQGTGDPLDKLAGIIALLVLLEVIRRRERD